eukprot:UN22255
MDVIFFQKNARAKKARIHFFGIYESPKDTNSIFLQATNAQYMHKFKSVKTAKCFRKRQSHFLQTQTVHKSSFQ